VKVVVTDPSVEKERDASVAVLIAAEVRPVPPSAVQVMPGVEVRPVSFVGLAVEPRVMGEKFRCQGFTIRATDIVAPGTDVWPQQDAPSTGQGEQAA
jgi:hypothetical protein